jgi:hypothetical protein
MATSKIAFHSTPRWREIFESARRETNLRRLAALIAFAEDAILVRWQELTRNDAAEREELAIASADLWELKVRKFEVYEETL